MKRIHKITMLLGAMAFAITACTNSDNEPNYGEITLTTPVVTLDGVKATVSRAESTSPNYSDMELHVELLDATDNTVNRSATYTYSSSSWTCDGEDNSPLVVTGGTGNYYARAWAEVDLDEVTGTAPVPTITGAIYATESNAQMEVKEYGTFTFSGTDNALKPKTAAIVLNVTNANGEEVTGYDVTYHLDRITAHSWDQTSSASEGTSNESNGNFAPKEISSDTKIMTITTGDVTYSVSTNSLILAAGNLYTFNVKLGGNSQITIGTGSGEGGGITVNGFEAPTAGGNITIGRQ